MDSRTGDLYDSREDALAAGVPPRHIVEIRGTAQGVGRVRKACADAAKRRKAKRQMQHESRYRNR